MPSTTRTVNVGLIGLGTVGGGVARVIARHHDEYLSAYGIDLRLKMASALEPERGKSGVTGTGLPSERSKSGVTIGERSRSGVKATCRGP